MPRSLVASDTFTYANGSLDTAAGGNWHDLSLGSFEITSNAATTPYTSFAKARWTGAGTWAADQYSKAKMTRNASSRNGVCVRVSSTDDPSVTMYAAWVAAQSGSNSNTVIAKWVSGTVTTISDQPGDGWATGDTIELEAVGSQISVFKNGVLLRSVTDTSIPGGSSTRAGIILSDGSGGAAMDDWEGGNITSGGGGTTKVQSVKLVDESGADAANLTGLTVLGWDTNVPATMATALPVDYTSTGTTDSAGILTFARPNTTLAAGNVAFVLVHNSTGSTAQSPSPRAFFGPVPITLI
jgi:hypothetical protein